MYAVLQTGGKQYRVVEGQTIYLEKLNFAAGDLINFSEVLMISDGKKIIIGDPCVFNSLIQAKVISHYRGNKVRIIKFRRRKHYRKQQGHRQWITEVKIVKISIKNERSILNGT